MNENSEFQPVTVSVPTPRLGEFHVMFGRWLAGDTPETAAAGAITEAAVNSSGDLRYWGTDPKDEQNAKILWDNMTDAARALLQVLMDTPGEWVDAEVLASHFGDDRYRVAGYLGWPGRYSAQMGMRHPVSYRKDSEGKTYYRVKPEVADLFRAAQKEA